MVRRLPATVPKALETASNKSKVKGLHVHDSVSLHVCLCDYTSHDLIRITNAGLLYISSKERKSKSCAFSFARWDWLSADATVHAEGRSPVVMEKRQ
jgi:hypothetical protein